jgi:hypothetical protein
LSLRNRIEGRVLAVLNWRDGFVKDVLTDEARRQTRQDGRVYRVRSLQVNGLTTHPVKEEREMGMDDKATTSRT